MIIAKIDSKNDHCDANFTLSVRGGLKTILAEYTMIGVRIAEEIAKEDPHMAKMFENMMRQACEDGLLTNPENVVKDMKKDEFTLKDALDKLKDILEELEE